MTPVLTKTLAKERRPFSGWLAGLVLIIAITIGSWPSIEESSEDFEQIFNNLPDALTALFGEGIGNFSAAGIIGSRLYGTLGMILFIGWAVSRGARGIAGEEADGTLEMLVTMPVSRVAIAVDKAVAGVALLAVLLIVETGLLLAAMPLVGLDFPVGHVGDAALGMFLLSAIFGGLAFLTGCATGSRGAAVAVGGGSAGGLFLLTGFGQLVSALEPLSQISPFSHYDGSAVLSRGLSPGVHLSFAVVAVVLYTTGVWAFTRRDLS